MLALDGFFFFTFITYVLLFVFKFLKHFIFNYVSMCVSECGLMCLCVYLNVGFRVYVCF